MAEEQQQPTVQTLDLSKSINLPVRILASQGTKAYEGIFRGMFFIPETQSVFLAVETIDSENETCFIAMGGVTEITFNPDASLNEDGTSKWIDQ